MCSVHSGQISEKKSGKNISIIFGQEFGKKSLNMAKGEKIRESLLTSFNLTIFFSNVKILIFRRFEIVISPKAKKSLKFVYM